MLIGIGLEEHYDCLVEICLMLRCAPWLLMATGRTSGYPQKMVRSCDGQVLWPSQSCSQSCSQSRSRSRSQSRSHSRSHSRSWSRSHSRSRRQRRRANRH